MKSKKMNARSKQGSSLNDKFKVGPTDESAIMEKLKLQNTALEKIKTAVFINNVAAEDEGE
jgi:hypothetical protein